MATWNLQIICCAFDHSLRQPASNTSDRYPFSLEYISLWIGTCEWDKYLEFPIYFLQLQSRRDQYSPVRLLKNMSDWGDLDSCKLVHTRGRTHTTTCSSRILFCRSNRILSCDRIRHLSWTIEKYEEDTYLSGSRWFLQSWCLLHSESLFDSRSRSSRRRSE